MGANQIVFWLSVRIFNSLSRRFKQRCRTRAKEIKEKNIPLLRWDTSEIFFDLMMDWTNGIFIKLANYELLIRSHGNKSGREQANRKADKEPAFRAVTLFYFWFLTFGSLP